MTEPSKTPASADRPIADPGDLLAAGGLLPAGTTLKDHPTDQISARAYRHPALADRPVVALVGDTIAPGVDNETSLLGFGSPQVAAAVGAGPRRGLGFPAAILVHQPEHQAAALAVVDDMNRAARRAKSKPGHAKDLYDEISRRLEPPSLLPSFYEEAGRAFVAADAHKYAAQMFERAREVERTYALDVDEEARRDAFLEFAFSGALTAKSLANYSSGLSDQLEPEAALDAFVDLSIRRTLGGLPPMADTLKIVKRMAKATERDTKERAATEADLMRVLLSAPATANAPGTFWKSARTILVKLAKDDVDLSLLLLRSWPETGRNRTEFSSWWLELLTDCGAIELLKSAVGPSVDAGIDPAVWLSRFHGYSQPGTWRLAALAPHVHQLINTLAPIIAAGTTPVNFVGPRDNFCAEATDLALELKLPVADPTGSLALRGWIHREDGERRPLTHLLDDPRHRPPLEAAIIEWTGSGSAALLNRFAHFRPAIGRAIENKLETLEAAMASDCRLAMLDLERIGPAGFAHHPDLVARLDAITAADLLARQLRAGVADEMGWPELDAAVEGRTIHLAELGNSWPILTIQTDGMARAIGPAGQVASTPLPKERTTATYIGDQFLMVIPNWEKTEAYWSEEPSNTFKPPGAAYHHMDLGYVITDEKTLSTGGPAIAPGDRARPGRAEGIVGDGTHWWKQVPGTDQRLRWREFDPTTGTTGRESIPTWFEEASTDGWDLQFESTLMPLPASKDIEDTPLGQANGLTGTRITARQLEETDQGRLRSNTRQGRASPLKEVRLERIDGVSLTMTTSVYGRWTPVGLIDWPGCAEPLVLKVGDGSVSLWTASNQLLQCPHGHRDAIRAHGTRLHPPLAFWHHFRPRDREGSQVLRTIDPSAAESLLAPAIDVMIAHNAAHPLPARRNHSRSKDRPEPNLTDIIPAVADLGITSPNLRQGVAGITSIVADLHLSLVVFRGRIAELTTTEPADDVPEVPRLDLKQLGEAMAGLPMRLASGRGPALGNLLHDNHQFRPGDQRYRSATNNSGERVGPSAITMIEGVAPYMARATSPFIDDSDREAILTLLDVWSTTIFCEHPEKFFIGRLISKQDNDGHRNDNGVVWRQRQFSNSNHPVEFLELPNEPNLSAVAPEDEIVERRPVECTWGSPAELQEFIAQVRKRGPVAWQPAAADELARRTGISTAEAKLLWAVCPSLVSYPGSQNQSRLKEVRAALDLKAKEAEVARDTLWRRGDARHQLGRVFDGLLTHGIDRWWEPLGDGPDDSASPVALLAQAVVDRFGKAVSIPEDALSSAPDTRHAAGGREGMLTMLAEPENHQKLGQPANPPTSDDLRIVGGDNPGDMSAAWLEWVIIYLHWALYQRPVGDPLYANVAEVVRTLKQRLDEPERLLTTRGATIHLGSTDEAVANLQRLGPEFTPFHGQTHPRHDGVSTAIDGSSFVAIHEGARYLSARLFLRPARFDELPTEIEAVFDRSASLTALRMIRAGRLDAFAARAADTPVSEGEFEANPAASVPDLVATVGDVHGIDAEPATYYLQLLALLEPTDANVKRWNGWTAARIKKAGAALVEAGLVVEAKRARAGRKFFLPGKWITAKAPHLPLEAWKLESANLELTDDEKVVSPLPLWIEPQPPHIAFAEAWDRSQLNPPT